MEEEAPRTSGWDERRDRISGEYERVAVRLFAERGFRHVTVDDVAAELGVSARTLFRYFPSKEDMLLAFPRRNAAETLAALEAIEPSGNVVEAIWNAYRELRSLHERDLPYTLEWSKAVSGAPHVLSRIAGELTISEGRALARLCAKDLGVRAREDVRAHAIAGVIHSVNASVLRFWFQRKGKDDLATLYDQAYAAVQLAVGATEPRSS